jgi:hypothetical protein
MQQEYGIEYLLKLRRAIAQNDEVCTIFFRKLDNSANVMNIYIAVFTKNNTLL